MLESWIMFSKKEQKYDSKLYYMLLIKNSQRVMLKSNVRKLDHVLEERTKIRQQKVLFNAFQRHLS